MQPGCYYIRLEPTEPTEYVNFYHGTLRVENKVEKDPGTGRETEVLRASGDIYERPEKISEALVKELGPLSDAAGKWVKLMENADWPDPTKGIPVFPRSLYYGYLETAPIASLDTIKSKKEKDSGSSSHSARFRFHKFDRKTKTFISPGLLNVVVNPVADTATAGPPVVKFEGRVVNERTGDVVGKLQLTRITKVSGDNFFLRKAKLVITTIGVEKVPLDNALSKEIADWQSVFREAGWDLEQTKSALGAQDLNQPFIIKENLNEPWTDRELQLVMEKLRTMDNDNLDQDWIYRMVCVSTFANPQYERGVTFDVAGTDSKDAPTEVVAIAADWLIPKKTKQPEKNEEAEKEAEDWKNVKATKFQDAPGLYFRTAVHEIGHAAGLGHRHSDFGFMNTTDVIARRGMSEALEARKEAALAKFFHTAKIVDEKEVKRTRSLVSDKREFPDNVQWQFSEKDLERLRHAPDVMVRPGAFNAHNLPVFDDEAADPASEFQLRLRPLLESVPFGAPVRVKLNLENVSDFPQDQVPKTLHLKSGLVSGTVTDPFGVTRPFEALMKSLDRKRYLERPLRPGEPHRHTVTLLRGHEGALFPAEGDYRITAKIAWRRHGRNVFSQGETFVRVNPPEDMAQRLAARDLLDTPRVLYMLVTGMISDQQTGRVLNACLANPVLAPHFRIILVKQLIGQNDIQGACKELGPRNEIILSISEIGRLIQLLGPHKKNTSFKEDVESALGELERRKEKLLNAEPFE